ncbi:beta-lactamase/transpeptidase-like protein [Mycena rosella]|uniref:Beta-lactamase/transpeptidase-like protein n=1 Tax=Mycena rosella TaxID=1033263 RepID=A0AAD7GEU1_MYCRO|nr:beta-lactamase/transpeptidase-like protein [Mycena rosella]
MRSIFALLVLTASLGQCASQVPLNDFLPNRRGTVITKELSSYIQSQLQASNVTGMSLGIVLPNGEVEFAAWGSRTEAGDAVTSGTIFHLGSCSKAFLSASLGILMQDFADGKNRSALPDTVAGFNWNTKMRDLLPGEWMVEDEWTTEKADLKDLLSHVTGLPGLCVPLTGLLCSHDVSYAPDDSARDVVVRMRHLRAAYELRQVYEYNNQQMFITGARVVSKYAGMSYRDFVEQRILAPLGMTSSTLHPDRAFATGNFTQSWTPSRRRIPFFMPERTADLIAGAGGVMSTAEDMTRWIKVLLNGGVDARTNTTIIPRATFDLATSAISVAINKGNQIMSIAGYGLGWGRLSYRGHELVQHNGGAPGVATIVDLYPYDGFGVVLLANTRTSAGVTRNIASTIADRILGLPTIDGRVLQEETPTPEHQRSPASQSHTLFGFTGTYTNPGYGNFTLCSPIFPPFQECRDVVEAFRTVDAVTGRPPRFTDLFAAWPRFWGSHLRLYPVSGSGYDYKVELTTLYIEGYGVDRNPFEDVSTEDISATFMTEEGRVVGLGLFVAEKGSWRGRRGGSVRDRADVWFDKL